MSQQKSGNNPLFQQGHIKQGVSVPIDGGADPAPADAPAADQSPESGDSTPKE